MNDTKICDFLCVIFFITLGDLATYYSYLFKLNYLRGMFKSPRPAPILRNTCRNTRESTACTFMVDSKAGDKTLHGGRDISAASTSSRGLYSSELVPEGGGMWL